MDGAGLPEPLIRVGVVGHPLSIRALNRKPVLIGVNRNHLGRAVLCDAEFFIADAVVNDVPDLVHPHVSFVVTGQIEARPGCSDSVFLLRDDPLGPEFGADRGSDAIAFFWPVGERDCAVGVSGEVPGEGCGPFCWIAVFMDAALSVEHLDSGAGLIPP